MKVPLIYGLIIGGIISVVLMSAAQDIIKPAPLEEKVMAMYGRCQVNSNLQAEQLQNLLEENIKLKEEIKKLKP